MCDYNEYSIVWPDFCIGVLKPLSISHHKRIFIFQTPHTSWEFTIDYCENYMDVISIKNIHGPANQSEVEPLAEIVIWRWNYNKIQIEKKELFKRNENKPNICATRDGIHFTIREISRRKLITDVCRPLAYLASDAFAISVSECTFVVSVQRMMQISPVFREELLAHEKTSGKKAEVKDAEPEHFRAFLEVVDHEPNNVRPNPTNVVGVLKLAHRFQATLALDRCEEHLLNCVEIPLIERLQLADTYGLAKLKESILSIGSVKLRPFYQSNSSTLHQEGLFSRKLLDELALRLCKND